HSLSRGTRRLIREGASLVESPEEILAEMGLDSAKEAPNALPNPVGESGLAILGALRGETLTAEELASRLSRPLPTVLVTLVELEMAGHVARTPGGLYRLVRASA